MEEEIVIDKIDLFRCVACNYLNTVDDIQSGKGCPGCGHRKFVRARMVDPDENKRLEELYKAGKLTLLMPIQAEA